MHAVAHKLCGVKVQRLDLCDVMRLSAVNLGSGHGQDRSPSAGTVLRYHSPPESIPKSRIYITPSPKVAYAILMMGTQNSLHNLAVTSFLSGRFHQFCDVVC